MSDAQSRIFRDEIERLRLTEAERTKRAAERIDRLLREWAEQQEPHRQDCPLAAPEPESEWSRGEHLAEARAVEQHQEDKRGD